MAALDHPHICALYDIGHENGGDFLVMQYLEGQTLAEQLQKGALPLDQGLKIAIEIADALDKAHRAGIVHRDLEPANIMLTKAGSKLLDFGLAKLKGPAGPISMSGLTRLATPPTASGTILGTVQYMAPEQVEGKEADARSDIWALGAVIYEMTTGKRPFEGESPASVIGAILKDDPPPVSTRQPLAPSSLDRVVSICLSTDRMLMAVSVSVRPAFNAGLPMPLFRARVPVTANPYRRQYAAAPDGQRFLVNTAPENAADARHPGGPRLARIGRPHSEVTSTGQEGTINAVGSPSARTPA